MLASPLRYPGGKAKLFPQLAELIAHNGLFGADYVEPYAGGAGLALRLLTAGYVRTITLNDLDPALYAFWSSVLEHPDELCRLVKNCELSVDEWHRQRKIYVGQDLSDPLSLGFSAFYLNRTSRSGIIEGSGPIGGYLQMSRWTIDVRFNRATLSRLISSIATLRNQIRVTNFDAAELLIQIADDREALVYLDPPYYVKGQRLYKNYYAAEDHRGIAEIVTSRLSGHWLVSYDDAPAIAELYSPLEPIHFSLSYSAARKRVADELMFIGPSLGIPERWRAEGMSAPRERYTAS